LLNNVELILRKPARLFIRLGSTDGKFFRKAGIPTITYGPNAQLMGRVNEFVYIRELMYTAMVHLGTAYDFLYSK
jgi:acetylornithine deacetylase/succinyl-diaminopimelate desuccinylase-like protein